jgi:hypothetical protein
MYLFWLYTFQKFIRNQLRTSFYNFVMPIVRSYKETNSDVLKEGICHFYHFINDSRLSFLVTQQQTEQNSNKMSYRHVNITDIYDFMAVKISTEVLLNTVMPHSLVAGSPAHTTITTQNHK